MYSLGLGSGTRHFDWLWFSVVIFIVSKFPCWGVKTTLICEYKGEHLEGGRGNEKCNYNPPSKQNTNKMNSIVSLYILNTNIY